jgi:hypothetical protein
MTEDAGPDQSDARPQGSLGDLWTPVPEGWDRPADPPPKRARRFSLAGLVVVVAVSCSLVGLMALVVPRMREYARRTSCHNNLSAIGCAMSSYAGDNGECFPCVRSNDMTEPVAPGEGTKSLALLYPSYVDNAKTFCCPACACDYRNFEIPGFSELPNDDPRLKWATSYWYDYRHRDGQLSTIVLMGDAASASGWNRAESRSYYRPVSHEGRGANLMFMGARTAWVGCTRGGTAMAGNSATDPNVYTQDTAPAQHDTCLVN